MPTTHLRLAAVLAAVLALPLFSQAAWALDKEDILRLHEAGLDAGTIVNVIRGTTEELELTAADVDELEAAGLPEPILAELRLRLGVDSDNGNNDGNGNMQDQLEEEQRLEAERLRIEQERRDREREQLRQELEQQQAQSDTLQSEFEGLRSARGLYEEGNFMGAAAVYTRFLEEMQPAEGSTEWYEAKLGLVRALYRAGMRSAIRADVLELALMGSAWPDFDEVIRILHNVVRDTGFSSPRIADLANEQVNQLDADFQDEFHYFLGRYYFETGFLTDALAQLGDVQPNARYGARAAFLSAVMCLNPEINENQRAVNLFQQAIISADPESDTDREVAENAYLALARIAYQVGDFGGASYYYNKIPQESPRWTTALFEGGWNFFLSGNLDRALGNFHALQSPYHSHRFYPDLFVVEAAAYLYECNIDEAHEAVDAFEDQIGPLREETTNVLANLSDPMGYYDAVVDPEGAREAGLVLLPPQARQAVLADTDFRELYEVIHQLEAEVAVLRENTADLGSRGEEMMSDLEGELSNRRLEAGVKIHDVVEGLSRELDDWWFKAQEVALEITDLEAQYLETILSRGANAIQEGTTFFVVADDWQFWPWEGEYWLDEVGAYRGNLTTRCPDDVEF